VLNPEIVTISGFNMIDSLHKNFPMVGKIKSERDSIIEKQAELTKNLIYCKISNAVENLCQAVLLQGPCLRSTYIKALQDYLSDPIIRNPKEVICF
jgi:hypothetical protein